MQYSRRYAQALRLKTWGGGGGGGGGAGGPVPPPWLEKKKNVGNAPQGVLYCHPSGDREESYNYLNTSLQCITGFSAPGQSS